MSDTVRMIPSRQRTAVRPLSRPMKAKHKTMSFITITTITMLRLLTMAHARMMQVAQVGILRSLSSSYETDPAITVTTRHRQSPYPIISFDEASSIILKYCKPLDIQSRKVCQSNGAARGRRRAHVYDRWIVPCQDTSSPKTFTPLTMSQTLKPPTSTVMLYIPHRDPVFTRSSPRPPTLSPNQDRPIFMLQLLRRIHPRHEPSILHEMRQYVIIALFLPRGVLMTGFPLLLFQLAGQRTQETPPATSAPLPPKRQRAHNRPEASAVSLLHRVIYLH